MRMLQKQIFDLKLRTIRAETVTFFVLVLGHNNQNLSRLSVLNGELKVSACKQKICDSELAKSLFVKLQFCQFRCLGKDDKSK